MDTDNEHASSRKSSQKDQPKGGLMSLIKIPVRLLGMVFKVSQERP
jgi:hypothetical protein